ncbi:MAG: LamG-like jellyroll fold domain-containing protein, partial [Bacteriovoracaceae bacterium]
MNSFLRPLLSSLSYLLLLVGLSCVPAGDVATNGQGEDESGGVQKKISGINIVSSISISEDQVSPFINFIPENIPAGMSCAMVSRVETFATNIVTPDSFQFYGSTPNCIVQLTPVQDQSGLTYVEFNVEVAGKKARAVVNVFIAAAEDAPVIDAPLVVDIIEDAPVVPIAVKFYDPETSVSCSDLTVSSSNEAVIRSQDLYVSGSVPNCFLNYSTQSNVLGESTIAMSGTDGVRSTTHNMKIVVNFFNDLPEFSSVTDFTMSSNSTSSQMHFSISDEESTLQCQNAVSAKSLDQTILQDAGIVIGGGLTENCTLTFTPVLNAAGIVPIELSVTDGEGVTTTQFELSVNDLIIRRKVGEANPTTASTVTFEMLYSEGMQNVMLEDFVLTSTGTATGSLATLNTISNTRYEVVVNGISGDGTLRVDFYDINAPVLDLVNVPLSFGTKTGDETFTIDRVGPSITSIVKEGVVPSPTNQVSVSYIVTFSEDVQNVAVNDFTLTATGTAGGLISTVTATSASVYRVTVNSVIGDGLLRLDFSDGDNDVADLAGNLMNSTSYTSGGSIEIDNTPPTVASIVRKTGELNPTTANEVRYTVTFDEDVTNVATTDFEITKLLGTVTGAVNDIELTASADEYDVVLGSIVGSGRVRLDLDDSDNSITDIAGNAIVVDSQDGDETFELTFKETYDFSLASEYSNQENVDYSGGVARAEVVDIKVDTEAEFKRGKFNGTEYRDGALTLVGKKKAGQALDASWTPRYSDIKLYFDFEGTGTINEGNFLVSPIGNDGTYKGSPYGGGYEAEYVDGKIGKSLNFDGSGDSVTFKHPVTLDSDTNHFTYSLWFYPRNYGATDPDPSDYWGMANNSIIFGRRSGAHPQFNLGLLSNGHARYYVRNNDGSINRSILSKEMITLNQWHHAVVVGDKDKKTVKFYLNGEVQGVMTYDDFTVYATNNGDVFFGIGNLGVANSPQNLVTGTRNYNNWRQWFDGLLDEFAIWDEPLTATEIQKIYYTQKDDFVPCDAEMTNCMSLSSDWTPKYDQIKLHNSFENIKSFQSGGKAESLIGPDGEITNLDANGLSAYPNRIGESLKLIDNDNRVVFNNLSIDQTTFSISFWLSLSQCPSAHEQSINTGTWGDFVFGISPNSSGNTSHCKIFVGTDSGNRIDVDDMVEHDNWNHFVFTFNNGTGTLYKDGVQVAQRSGMATAVDFSSLGVDLSRHGGTYYIDELALWDAVLDAADVQFIYQKQKGVLAGSYESQVFDLGMVGTWPNLSWETPRPSGKGLVPSGSSEATLYYPNLTQTSLSNGLKLYWNFDEQGGTWSGANSVIDRSGSGKHGSPAGSLYKKTHGMSGGALDLKRRNGRIEQAALGGESFWNTAFTSCVWAKYRDMADNQECTMSTNCSPAGTTPGWATKFDSAGLPKKATFLIGDGSTFTTLKSSERVHADQWTHLCVGFHNASDQMAIWVNGKKSVKSTALTGIDAGVNVFRISQSNLSRAINGLVDEVAVWDRYLSDNEIRELFERGLYNVEFQVRSCDDKLCDGESWQGYSGDSSTFFSELQNNTSLNFGFPNGNVKPEGPYLSLGSFPNSVSDNQYFQWRTILSANARYELCDTDSDGLYNNLCLPRLNWVSLKKRTGNVAAGPEENRYKGGSISFVSERSRSYEELLGFNASLSAGCGAFFQLSPDNGANFYYHDGGSWTSVTDDSIHRNTLADVNTNVGTFHTDLGNGVLKYKVVIESNTIDECLVDDIEIEALDSESPMVTRLYLSPDYVQSDSEVTYRVVFSKGVTGVATEDFEKVNLSGSLTSGGFTVTQINDAIYDVTLGGISGSGSLRVDFDDDNGTIQDLYGNVLGAGGTSIQGEYAYALGNKVWNFDDISELRSPSNLVEIDSGEVKKKKIDLKIDSKAEFDEGTHFGTYYDESDGRIKLLTSTSEKFDVDKILPLRAGNLKGYWKFDGNVLDSSGNGNHGTLFGDAHFTDGKLGTSISLDGSGDYIQIGTQDSIRLKRLKATYLAWIKTTNSAQQNVFDYDYFNPRLETSSGRLRVYFKNAGGGFLYPTQDNSLHSGEWKLVAYVFDGSKVRVYLDGENPGGTSSFALPVVNSATLFRIGKNSGSSGGFNGEIDEVSMWDTALTQEEIKLIFDTQKETKTADQTRLSADWTPKYGSILSYYPFDGDLNDVMGTNNCTQVNGTEDYEKGQIGQSQKVDGAERISCGSSFPTNGPRAFSMWLKHPLDGVSVDMAMSYLINGDDFAVGITTSNRITMRYGTDNSNVEISHFQSVGIKNTYAYPNEYFHLAVNLDEHKGIESVFINGRPLAAYATTSSYGAAGAGLYFADRGSSSRPWRGGIDEVAIFDEKLTPEEFKTIYVRQKTALGGIYTSKIYSRGHEDANWPIISWKSSRPTNKELLGNGQADLVTIYPKTIDSTGAFADSDLNDGLLGFWRFEETTDDTATGGNDIEDISGNGRHLFKIGATTYAEPGVLGNSHKLLHNSGAGTGQLKAATTFDGTLINGEITFCSWIKVDKDNMTSNYHVITRINNSNCKFSLNYRSTTNHMRVNILTDSSGWQNYSFSDSVNLGDQWQHLCVTRNLDGQTYDLYLNGKHSQSLTAGDRVNQLTGNHFIFIGPERDSTYAIQANFDETGYWSRKLHKDEIRNLYLRKANRLQFQVRSCDDPNCVGENWKGADGDNSYISELNNVDSSGNVKSEYPYIKFDDLNTGAMVGEYFQWRAILESDDENSLCDGICSPEISEVNLHSKTNHDVTLADVDEYMMGPVEFEVDEQISFSDLVSFDITTGGSCTPYFQLSNDGGDNYYYHNGSFWTDATDSEIHRNNLADLQNNLTSFVGDVGIGSFSYKVIFDEEDSSLSCSVTDLSIETFDQAEPNLVSITRRDGENEVTDTSATLFYTVKFDKEVSTPAIDDFTFTAVSGGVIGTILNPIRLDDGKTYTVRVQGLVGSGKVRLDLNDADKSIEDVYGQELSSNVQNGDETFSIKFEKQWSFAVPGNYTVSSGLEIVGGDAALKTVDLLTDDQTKFEAGELIGTVWDAYKETVTLGDDGTCDGTQMNCIELHSSWTPEWKNIVGYWKFDGNGDAGVGSDGTLVGDVGFTSPGKLGAGSATFDGAGDYVDTAQLGSNDRLSFSMWLKGDPTIANYGTVFANSWPNDNQFTLRKHSGQSKLYFGAKRDGVDRRSTFDFSFTIDRWQHVVVTYDKGAIKAYIDGVEVTTTSSTDGLGHASGKFQIGISNVGGTDRFWKGEIDDLAVWRGTVLSADNAKLIYEKQKQKFGGIVASEIFDMGDIVPWDAIGWKTPLAFGKEIPDNIHIEDPSSYSETIDSVNASGPSDLKDGLVGLWHMNGDGTDKSGYGNDFTGGTFDTDNKKFGSASLKSSANVSDDDSLDLPSNFTLSSWIYITDPGTVHADKPVSKWGNTADANFVMYIFGDNNGASSANKGRLTFYGNRGGAWGHMSSNYYFSEDEYNHWHHVVLSFDSGIGGQLYVNGKKKGGRVGPGALAVNGVPLKFAGGKHHLDEIALWERNLTDLEILDLYRRGANRIDIMTRSCNDSSCSGDAVEGPDGSKNSGFSEFYNNSSINGSDEPDGDILETFPYMSFDQFS